FADRALLPRPCPAFVTLQADEIWDRFLHGFVFVTLLLLDLLPGEVKRMLFFFWRIRFLEKYFETQRDEVVGARVEIFRFQPIPIFLKDAGEASFDFLYSAAGLLGSRLC